MGPIIIIAVFTFLRWLAFATMPPATLTWALAVLFGIISVFFIAGNPIAGFIAMRRKKSFSCVPFVGGVFGVLSMLFWPIQGARYFAWVPLVLDITFPMFLYAVFVMGAFRSK
jgi:hypothetical protein